MFDVFINDNRLVTLLALRGHRLEETMRCCVKVNIKTLAKQKDYMEKTTAETPERPTTIF